MFGELQIFSKSTINVETMWRATRKVLANRSTTLRWPLQAADKNEDANDLEEREKRVSYDAKKAHGAIFLSMLPPHESCNDNVNGGFNVAHSIIHQIQRDGQNRSVDPCRSIEHDDGDEENSKTVFGNLKSWWHGVLALTSVLGVQHFTSSDRPTWRIDPKHLPHVLLRFMHPKPQSFLAVLPGLECSQPKTEPAKEYAEGRKELTDAIKSFQSTFTECSAATQNKLGIKFAALNQKKKAFLLFSLASEQGHPPAQFNMGLCYEHGRGTGKDLFKAAECYRDAGSQGHGGSFYSLAQFHLQGVGGLPKDKQKSVELLEAAAKTGLTKAQGYLGMYYAKSSEHQDLQKAFSYFHMAAVKKDPVAEYYTGVCYERGLGVERDPMKAGNWYKFAAKHGNVAAQYNLGVFYEHGLGDLPVDKQEALRFYRMAAEAGDEDAQHNLELLRKQLEGHKLHSSQSTVFLNLLHEMTQRKNGLTSKDVTGIPRCASSPLFTDGYSPDCDELMQAGNQSSTTAGQLLAF